MTRLVFTLFTIAIINNTFAINDSVLVVNLSLKNVVNLAITKSSSVKNVRNKHVSYYWRWKNFNTKFRPQLKFNSTLPQYRNMQIPVMQGDGSTEFRQVKDLKTYNTISLNQSIAATGTYISAYTDFTRLQNMNASENQTQFSGSPVSISIWQPILAFNWNKWNKLTEPLVYEESQKQFIQSIEEISFNATKRFFWYLKAQTNYNLAISNLKNSEDNLKIAEVKMKLGHISENNFSRIKLSVYNAKKALGKANMDLKNADFNLKSYIGLDQNTNIELEIPLNMFLTQVNPDSALNQALTNRKETIIAERRLIDAERDLTRAKRSNGPKITVWGKYGVSNSSIEYADVYNNSKPSQELMLNFEIPLVDWGLSASEVKMAEYNRDLVVYDVEQNLKDFKRSVIIQVEQFKLLNEQMNTVKEADIVAENGYEIALKKFQNGEISITDLNIALAERENAKRDYINSIEAYWKAYYQIRILTLFDFEQNQKIVYYNEMLKDQL